MLPSLNSSLSHKIMSFGNGKTMATEIKDGVKNSMEKNLSKANFEKKPRKVNKKPYKILEAPNLQDDFYLNLLDWSENNQIAVGLDSSLYLWSGCSSEVCKLY